MGVDGTSDLVAADASNQEFAAFFHLLRYYAGDSAQIKLKLNKSSAVKANDLLALYFMLPAFYSSPLDLQCHMDTPWAFPIFLTRMDDQRLYCKYIPRPDIMVKSESLFPLLITSDAISNKNEMDRAQMQIQAIALARAGQYLINDPHELFFVVAIYFTDDLVAERYIVAQPDTSNEQVFMCQKILTFAIKGK
ncbi:hypothetical protein BD779DRAFT_914334 [Infundibulicybe gibba]|nr:hypothetical protein BD779DRAFT_914334 [Infundibulicybe gibba]